MKPSTLLSSLIAITLVSLTAHRANATTRTVTNLNDSGAGSLRQAIIDSVSGDTINFAVTGTIYLSSGELQINHDLTISGPGAASLTITRSSSSFFRIFYFDNGTWNVSGLTISNGHDTVVGGGIYNGNGNLTVTDCTITGNYSNSSGGGISNNSDGLSTNVRTTVQGCTISGNTSTDGGGIANSIGTLTVSNCTFTGNNSNHGTISNKQLGAGTGNVTVNNCTFSSNAADLGGALDGGPVTVTNCTFKNNGVAGRTGAGGAINCAGGTVTNCTFSNNTATKGGAIFSDRSLTVLSCTFSGNSATLGNSIGVTGSATVLHLGNTILQSAGANFFVDTGGTSASSMGYNLSSDNGGGFLTGPADQINTDAQLDPNGPVNNGGPTKTIALIAGSPAIDRGNRFGLTTDQRGSSRPVDNPNVANATDGSDIGAYEAPADPVQGGAGFVVTKTDDHDDGVCGAADCTLREAVARANTVPGASTIIFAHGLTGSITLTQGELAVTDSLTITGIPIGTISGNGASRIFNFTGGTSYLIGLTIRDGRNQLLLGNVTNGGGIYNSATLYLYGCSLTNNRVQGTNTLPPSVVSGGAGQGGGIYNSGSLFLDTSIFSQTNQASGGNGGNGNFGHGGVASGNGGAGRGGAVFNGASGSVLITNCTFNSNVAVGGNGGSGGPLGGNGGNGDGGAIYNLGAITIKSATIDGNSGGGGAAGTGTSNGVLGVGNGGVVAAGGTATVASTIVAGNLGSNGGANDVKGTFISSGYNLIGNGDFSTGFNASGDQVGTTAAPIDPKLGPLQNNGGGTPTMALLTNSPAIDQGKRFSLAIDQRGHERPFDAANVSNASGGDGSDIGAFELGGTLVPISAVSRKMHGTAGPFDIALPLSGPVGVECRTGGATGDFQIVLTFAAPVSINGTPQAQITSGTAQIGSNGVSNGGTVAVNGAVVTVPLTNVANAQKITLTLSSASDGANTNNVNVPIGFLLGDTSGNGIVNSSDVSQTKLKSGQAIDASNFREDVSVNGTINSSDVSTVKQKSGTALP